MKTKKIALKCLKHPQKHTRIKKRSKLPEWIGVFKNVNELCNQSDVSDIQYDEKLQPCDICFDFIRYGDCWGCITKSHELIDHPCIDGYYCIVCNFSINYLKEKYENDPCAFID